MYGIQLYAVYKCRCVNMLCCPLAEETRIYLLMLINVHTILYIPLPFVIVNATLYFEWTVVKNSLLFTTLLMLTVCTVYYIVSRLCW